MPVVHDGPRSNLFTPIALDGNVRFSQLAKAKLSEAALERLPHAPEGACTGWGIPFDIKKVVLLREKSLRISFPDVTTPWLVFMHTTDVEPLEWNADGLISPTRGEGRLGEVVADYIIGYADGVEARVPILRRHQIGMLTRRWGENCFQAVPHHKPFPVRPPHQQPATPSWMPWGGAQTRVIASYQLAWANWLWAWENPRPGKAINSLRFEHRAGTVIIAAVSAGTVGSSPLRWETRKKTIVSLPKDVKFDPTLDDHGLLKQIQIDMGQVISAQPRTVYPNDAWAKGYNNQTPVMSEREILVEYTAHPEAEMHFAAGAGNSRSQVKLGNEKSGVTPIAPSNQRVELRVIEKGSGKPVPVKLHVHGEAGEYLAPVDRHRIPNPAWYEDYSVDFLNQEIHCCTYITGEATIDLPLDKVYLEISKGFEIKPVRKVVSVSKATKTITITLEKVLPWRERGWVTADTHVHFLSPSSARLEGSAEGVNVVNLLASQWGELMTNVGDFDGTTTLGSKETGGDGEWLVRVGTENRQAVLGHISLIGYNGRVIAPMTTGGPEESALGDPVGALLTEWARQCRKQGGIVVLPHFCNPRAEHAASIVEGDIDALEMTAWGNLYGGIDPYSLSDWYRYLNCGYFVPAVGGTDKMSANTAVGAVRTYARINGNREFTYQAWMDAVRAGNTFVTYGPLMEFSVDGKPAGSRIKMKRSGGTVDVMWQASSVTVPMSRIDLMVNGEIRESKTVKAWQDEGHWALKVEKSSWVALLIRGHYADKPEIVAAHSSPVMISVEGTEFLAAADAATILDQIEGALAFLDTVGTRAETAAYKRMRLVLTSAHRKLHNRLHEHGHYHNHTPITDHKEHGTR